ncbi:MAG TPA: dTDP-4-dehydrorhamnose reductase, partial [Anaerolineales bacterium]|nr:dTDP-4-dehydrorhamnose reductase [Anaerolineales bacterium]
RPAVDITDADAVERAVAAHRPDVIVHAAALTDVDGAARDPDLAYRINGLGTQAVALAAARHGAVVAYVSSNEVFDGQAGRPYTEFDSVRAINPYGASKLAGEWFIQHLLQRFYIMRTSWVTGRGGRNFVHRIQQLADERGSLRVVNDEVANPTFVDDLADAITRLIITDRYGIYHLTNSGHVSRYDYARRILALSGRAHIPVEPITLAEFKRASTPPPFAPLANHMAAGLGIVLRPWEEALQDFLASPI